MNYYCLCNAGARAFQVGGPNLKVGGPNFFIDLFLKKYAVHKENIAAKYSAAKIKYCKIFCIYYDLTLM